MEEHYEKAQAEAVDALGRLASRNWVSYEECPMNP